MISATGQQFILTHRHTAGEMRAVIAQVGAALREFRIGNTEIIRGFPEDWPAPSSSGVVMAPWSNRLAGGRWVYEGRVLQNDITLIDQQNSNHGLLVNFPYQAVARSSDFVELEGIIYPRKGYPFLVQTRVRYQLSEDGLTITHSAMNLSAKAAPFGTGSHPYFQLSGANTADLVLTVPAKTVTTVDQRQIPTGQMPMEQSDFDLRPGRKVGELTLDHNFTDLNRDSAGLAWSSLDAPDGRGIRVWQDSNFKHVMIFTHKHYPTPDGEVLAVAIEPTTAPPNAFNSGEDLIWLEPNRLWQASWGISVKL